jgi:hypothetical protein
LILIVNQTGLATLAILAAACAAPMRIESRPQAKASLDSLASSTAASRSATPRAVSAAAVLPPIRVGDTVWTIEHGTYAGLKVVLRFDAAAGPRRRGEHFWRMPAGGGIEGGVVGWGSAKYPIQLAFRHESRGARISPSDSTAFWDAVGAMSADLGMSLFRPATLKEGDDPLDMIVVDLRAMANTDGLSRASWSPSGDLFDVRVTFHDAGVLHDRHVVTHEMMHALGFGHTKAWKSVVNPGDDTRTARLTAEDVAYAEVAMRLREKRERSDIRHLIALAIAREAIPFDAAAAYVLDGSDWPDSAGDAGAVKYCGGIPVVMAGVAPFCRLDFR